MGMLLQEMGALLPDLGVSLFILIMPTALFAHTAEFVWRRGSFENIGPLVILNIFLAISIISMASAGRVSTFTVMAMAGYVLLGVAIFSMMCLLLVARAWRYVHSRPRLRRIKPVQQTQFLYYDESLDVYSARPH